MEICVFYRGHKTRTSSNKNHGSKGSEVIKKPFGDISFLRRTKYVSWGKALVFYKLKKYADASHFAGARNQ